MIEIPDEANHILNIVKARYNLKTKSEAITKIVLDAGAEMLEPELRPEFVQEMRLIEKRKHFGFKNIRDLRNQIEG